MEKWLLVEKLPVVVAGFSSLISNNFSNIDFQVAKSHAEMQPMMAKTTYQLVIIGSSINMADQILVMLKLPLPKIILFVAEPVNSSFLLYLHQLYKMGVRGFLNPSDDTLDIVKGIKSVCEEKVFVSNCLSSQLITNHGHGYGQPDLLKQLGPRERAIAKMFCEGKTNKQVCEELALKSSTVSTFKIRIFSKLHVNSLLELAKKYKDVYI